MNNKGTSIIQRIEITLWLLKFIWAERNVAMIDVVLNKKDIWEHHTVISNLMTMNRNRVKEIVKSFKEVIEKMFWNEINN